MRGHGETKQRSCDGDREIPRKQNRHGHGGKEQGKDRGAHGEKRAIHFLSLTGELDNAHRLTLMHDRLGNRDDQLMGRGAPDIGRCLNASVVTC